ncbi:MAG TPA: hypothetical protein DIC52_23915, partial [Candidatus Latescibacteria bacterium]|nr:hypothetical protein [Candidatus Latescibacterota bacterium]
MDPTDLPAAIQTQPAVVPESVFVADGARIMGDVELGEECSIWFNAVVRGDVNAIRIGKRSNIQDGSIVHVTNDLPCIVGADV